MSNKVGLTNVITGQASIDNGCVQQTNIPNLFVLLSGSKSPSPTELLSSKSMEEILEEREQRKRDRTPEQPTTQDEVRAARGL